MEESEFVGGVSGREGHHQPVRGWVGAWEPQELDASGRGAESPVSAKARKMGKARGPGAVVRVGGGHWALNSVKEELAWRAEAGTRMWGALSRHVAAGWTRKQGLQGRGGWWI